jgi:hypothetical protein
MYLGAHALHDDWVFWALIPAALILGAVSLWWRNVVRAIVRFWEFLVGITAAVRNYPIALAEVESLKAQLAEANNRVQKQPDEMKMQYQAGRLEGRREIIGEVLGHAINKRPQIVAISKGETGVVLVGTYSEGETVLVGARFTVQVQATGEVKGIVELVSETKADRLVYLACVEKTSPRFWTNLNDRLDVDPTAPPGIVLGHYQISSGDTALPSGQPALEGPTESIGESN